MKSRLVRPEFWTDGKIVQLSAFARLLFIACWQLADDEGRFEWEPARIKLQVFPADPVDVGQLGAELGQLGLIWVYPDSGKEFACVPKFADHQKLHSDRPSKFPPPPDGWPDLGQFGPIRAESRPSRAPARTEPNLTQPEPEPLPSVARRAKFIPPTLAEVSAYAAERGFPGEAAGFVDYFTAKGWKIGKAGAPMIDWRAAFRTWERNAKTFASSRPASPGRLPTDAELAASYGVKLP